MKDLFFTVLSTALPKHNAIDAPPPPAPPSDVRKLLPEVFYKTAVLKNFAVFIGKNLCWSLFLIKLHA